MEAREGIYWRIRSKELPWCEKTALLLHAWNNDDEKIPDKEQALIDILCLALAGKKRVSKEDGVFVWKCFNEILKKCKNKNGEIVLKSKLFNIYQVLLDEMNHFVNKEPSHCLDNIILISCCQTIIEMSNGAANFDFNLALLGSILNIPNESITEDIEKLIDETADNLLNAYALQTNHQQVAQNVSQKVLDGIITYNGHHCGKLRNIIFTSILIKELENNYDLYLRLKIQTEETKSVPPKFLEALFNKLREGLCKKNLRNFYMDFLLEFYSRFLTVFREKKTTTGFMLFQYILMLFQCNECSEKEIEDVTNVKLGDSVSLEVLSSLLGVLIENDVHDIAADALADNKQLSFLQLITKNILSEKERCEKWYECLHQLLHMNHVTIEANIQSLLAAILIENVKDNDCEIDAQKNQLLIDLVTVYSKLRQIVRFYGKLVSVLRRHPDAVITWPEGLIMKLGESVRNLPQSTVFNAWTLLYDHLKETDCKHLQHLHLLVAHFLQHVRLWGQSITTATANKKVLQLMSGMWETVIEPITLDTQPPSFSQLYLMYYWGELHITVKCQLSVSMSGAFSSPQHELTADDFGYVYPLNDVKRWESFVKKIDDEKDKRLACMKHLLYIQKIKALLCFETDESSDRKKSIENTLSQWIIEIVVANSAKCETEWDKQLLNLDANTAQVAVWTFCLHHLPLMSSFMKKEQLSTIAQMIVKNLFNDAPCTSSKQCTMSSATWKFLSHQFNDMTELQMAIMDHAWRELKTLTKTKKGKAPHNLSSLFDVLAKSSAADIEQHFKSVMKDQTKLPNNALKFAQQFFRMLWKFPLEYINDSFHHSLLVGILTLSFSITSNQDLIMSYMILRVLLENCPVRPFKEITMSEILKKLLNPYFSKDQSITKEMWNIFMDIVFPSVLKLIIKDKDSVDEWTEWIVEKCKDLQPVKAPSEESEKIVDLLAITVQRVAKGLVVSERKQELHARLVEDFSMIQEVVFKMLEENKNRLQYQRLLLCLAVITNTTFVPKVKALKKKEIKAIQDIKSTDVIELNQSSSQVNPDSKHDSDDDASETMEVEEDISSESEANILELIPAYCEHCLNVNLDASVPEVSFLLSLSTNYICVKSKLNEDSLQSWWNHLIKILEKLKLDVTNSQHLDLEDESRDLLLYVGKYQEYLQTKEVVYLENLVGRTLSAIIAASGGKQLHALLSNLMSRLHQPGQSLVVFAVWSHLLDVAMDDDAYSVFAYACQEMLLQIQYLLLHQKTSSVITRDWNFIIAALKLIAKMLSHGSSLLSPQYVLTSVNAVHFTPLSELTKDLASDDLFLPVFTALHSCLNQVLVRHSSTVLQGAIPVFQSGVSELLVAAVHAGRQHNGTGSGGCPEQDAVTCAHLTTRLLQLVAYHKVDFAKVACYMISTYVGEVQKVTLRPSVKKVLLEGIYKLLSICDKHSVALLQRALPGGLKEIFRTVNEEFNKYHKYSGKV